MAKEARKLSKNWTYLEGKALITIYQNRKEEYFKTRNKKHFWEAILTDLEASDVLVRSTTSEQVETKWRSLYRAYKSAKDRGTGTSSTRFLYMEEMDAIFHDNPLISSSTAVSVGVQDKPVAAPKITAKRKDDETPSCIDDETPSTENLGNPSESRKSQKSKRKNKNALANIQLQDYKEKKLELKRQYYLDKIEEKKKRTQLLQEYLKEKKGSRAENN